MTQTGLPPQPTDYLRRGGYANDQFEQVASALRRLDEDLTQSVMLPPVDSVIRRADGMNRTVTAATAAVLTVGALGGVTVVAQSVVSGAVPLPVPMALAPAPPAVEQLAGPPAIAEVLNAGEQLVRLQPGVAAPAGSRTISNGSTVLPVGAVVPVVDTVPGTKFDSNGNTDSKDSDSRGGNDSRDNDGDHGGRGNDGRGHDGRNHDHDGNNNDGDNNNHDGDNNGNNGDPGNDHHWPGPWPKPPVDHNPKPPVDDPNPPVTEDPNPPVDQNPKPPVTDDPKPPVNQDPPFHWPPVTKPPVNQDPPVHKPPFHWPPVTKPPVTKPPVNQDPPATKPPVKTGNTGSDAGDRGRGGGFFNRTPRNTGGGSDGPSTFKRPARTPTDRGPRQPSASSSSDSSSSSGDRPSRTSGSGFSRGTGTGDAGGSSGATGTGE